MFRRMPAACVMAIATASSLLAQSPATPSWTVIAERLQRMALIGSTQGLREIRNELIRELPSSSGERLESALYTIAYAGWRMSTQPDVSKNEQDDLLDDAEDRLERVVKTAPDDAEALALLGTIYGQKAARSVMRAIVLGPRSMRTLERAATVAPVNPRVLLLQAVATFQTPAAFGGSRDKAEALLRRSLDAFTREPQGKAWPNWGRFDAHAWLGQLLRRKGDLDGARAEYEKARALAPDSPWLLNVLLPALERAGRK
jgi:tetratricopeptide (TPR) repeat protein